MIFENLKRFGQFYIIFGLAICLFVSESHGALYKAKLATAQIQLSTYQMESNRLAQRIELAQKDAQKAGAQYDTQIKGIWNAPVSNQCEDAVKWGIQQARLF